MWVLFCYFLNRTPMFDGYVVMWGSKNNHHGDTFFKDIGLHLSKKINYSAFNSEHNWKILYIWFKNHSYKDHVVISLNHVIGFIVFTRKWEKVVGVTIVPMRFLAQLVNRIVCSPIRGLQWDHLLLYVNTCWKVVME